MVQAKLGADFGVEVKGGYALLKEESEPSLLQQMNDPFSEADAVANWDVALGQVTQKMLDTADILAKQNEEVRGRAERAEAQLQTKQSECDQIQEELANNQDNISLQDQIQAELKKEIS